METDGGGWTLVWSYSFTNYSHFNSKSNAITPRPNWPVRPEVDVPIATTPPLNETDYNAMNFSLWKQLGRQVLIKSNIKNWLVCHPGNGSLVDWREGDVIKQVTDPIQGVVPLSFQLTNKIGMDRYSMWVSTCPAFITILTVTQESIGLPMILCGKMGPTKRKMLLIHMVTFLFEPSSKDIVKNFYIHISFRGDWIFKIIALLVCHPRTVSLVDWKGRWHQLSDHKTRDWQVQRYTGIFMIWTNSKLDRFFKLFTYTIILMVIQGITGLSINHVDKTESTIWMVSLSLMGTSHLLVYES